MHEYLGRYQREIEEDEHKMSKEIGILDYIVS
jgi:hypothetical protein